MSKKKNTSTKSAKTIGERANQLAKKAIAAARAKDAAANAKAVDPDRVPLSEIMKKPKNGKAGTEKKLSCLDAAAQVLKGAGKPMNCKSMIDAMSKAKLWTSDAPTPAATLYSAILRELQTKGKTARFKKTDRGLFAVTG